MAEMGEFVVGAYLRLIVGCEIVTYNQRLSRERGEFGETDVLAIDADGTTVYLCEVVTHLGGMLYAGGNAKTLEKLGDKFERTAAYSLKAFPNHGRILMLWSPYVPVGMLTEGLTELKDRLAKQGHVLELRINGDYTAAVEELRHLARRDTKDHGEPFFRALQILDHLRPPRSGSEEVDIHRTAISRSAADGGANANEPRKTAD